MTRVLVIVGLVTLSMITGVAGASTDQPTRLPVDVEISAHPDTVVVVRGDHLWKISARHLGPDASNDRISPYWRRVIAVNEPRLRSGDPDLIYPGEVVEMPDVGD
jgi:nucleoid-associated protein YgaU